MTPGKNMQLMEVLQRRFGTAQWDKWTIRRWQHYDYIRLSGTVQTTLNFFVNALGSNDPVAGAAKTLNETNMSQSNEFGQTYFLMEAIRTHINPLPKPLQPAGINDDADLLSTTIRDLTAALIQIMDQGVLKMSFGNKLYFEVPTPFKTCPPGFGLKLDEHIATATYSGITQQGSRNRDIYQLDPIQLIEPGQNIQAQIDFPNGSPTTLTDLVNSTTPSVNIGLVLDGYIARPVQ